MPATSLQKQILSLPFKTGLSQKEDPRWLEPGALLFAKNCVHPKTNIIQKRAGFTSLSTTFIPPNPGTAAVTILSGKRLGTDGTKLLAIAKDIWTDSAFTYDEKSGKWVLVDRVPEVYALPDRTLAGYDDVIRELDSVVCNGYRVSTWLVSAGSTNLTGVVYFKVENASTGETVVSPSPVDTTVSPSFEQVASKVVVCGTKVVLGFVSGSVAANYQLRLYTLDCTQPWVARFVGTTVINNLTAPISTPLTNPHLGSWDISNDPGSASTFHVVYQQLVSSTNTIQLSTLAATSPPALLTTNSLNGADAGYVADGEPYIYAFGLDVTGVLATVAYAHRVTGLGVPLRVKVQQFNLNTLATSAIAVDTFGSAPGPVSVTGTQPPHTIAIAPIAALAGNGAYKIAWSPYISEFDAIPPGANSPGIGIASAFIMTCGVFVNAGTMFVLVNQPHLTWGLCVASRWLPNVNGVAYILGRIPSWEQGTYYLFSDDAWQDQSGNNGSAPVSYYPLRLVATFAPRLSSLVLFNATFLSGVGSSTPVGRQDQYMPHALPHIVLNAAAVGTTVYESLISVSSTVQSQNPTLIQFDMASTKCHAMAVLGQNTGIASGCPSLTDGVRVHEFAFPYFPSITNVVPFASVSQGLRSYIVIYDWVDARGQLHRSARSGAQKAIMGGSSSAPAGDANITVTCMGFSSKEKALTAATPNGGPQSAGNTGAQVVSLITVRLFGTQANGEIYYELASAPNVQGQATITFADNVTDAQLATNPILYGDGLNAQQPGAILDNHCPPAFQQLIVHQNRYFGLDGKNIWASKELVDGEGAGFNELSAFSWDMIDGNATAMASFGARLILFAEDQIAYVEGQGPQDDGGQNDWSPPQAIATDTGCTDWRSIVVKHDGCYFDSPAGRRMLSFDLVVTPVTNVEDILDANPVTTSAVLHPTAGRVLTSCNTDDASVPRVGVTVDRDYILDSWMVMNSANSNGAVSAVVADAPNASGILAPTYHWMDASGVVWRETPAGYFDGGAVFIPLQAETAWVKAEGIEGFARFRRLQVTWQNLDPHALSVYVAYDYSPTYYLMGTVTAAMMSAMPNAPLCAQLFSLPRQRAQAVRFKVVDAVDAVTAPVTGQGPMLISMGLEVSLYTNRRTNRLTAAQRS